MAASISSSAPAHLALMDLSYDSARFQDVSFAAEEGILYCNGSEYTDRVKVKGMRGEDYPESSSDLG